MTEQELVALAKRGDQDAFAQLVETNQNKIYSFILVYKVLYELEITISPTSFPTLLSFSFSTTCSNTAHVSPKQPYRRTHWHTCEK